MYGNLWNYWVYQFSQHLVWQRGIVRKVRMSGMCREEKLQAFGSRSADMKEGKRGWVGRYTAEWSMIWCFSEQEYFLFITLISSGDRSSSFRLLKASRSFQLSTLSWLILVSIPSAFVSLLLFYCIKSEAVSWRPVWIWPFTQLIQTDSAKKSEKLTEKLLLAVNLMIKDFSDHRKYCDN